ncbi:MULTISPECIES: squalene/phytoene synthase family protein [Candidatus Ichthyocystis]|uniref:squalene/phytoene synthase family protein n=1 Tax=Candidatus Ichthyocystis TaxID=2929841 RepID=UPI000B8467F5|nr:squalene/phytoene synthase family protein [Candidatus Ichthyocystis hellenicum]
MKVPIICLGASLTTPGSDFYYAFRHIKNSKLQYLQTFCELIQEWDKTALTSQSETASYHKLLWWKTEIERFSKHKSQHPLTQRLQESELSYLIHVEYLEEIIDGFVTILPRKTTTVDTSTLLHQKLGGYLFTIIAELLGNKSHFELREANTQGILCQRIHCIRYYGYWIKQNILPISLERCNKFSIPLDVVFNPTLDRGKWQKFIKHEIDDILEHKKLSPKRKHLATSKNLSPIIISGEISILFLKKIRKNVEIINQYPVSITPIRSLILSLKQSW